MLSFTPFRLDVESERLWKNDQELRLRRKPFAILCHLAKNPHRLVTHAELVESVWGKVATSESLLRTHVRALRLALGEDIVETVAGRGYRFIVEVQDLDAQATRFDHPNAEGDCRKVVVGRDSQCGTLRAAFRNALERTRTTVFVSGEAGVGKTTLVDSFLEQHCVANRVLVGRGACLEHYGSGQAYFPVLDALSALCRDREAAIAVLASHAPTWLAQMPGLVQGDRLEEAQRRAAGATPARIRREFALAMEALSVDTPVAIVLDDLHWADSSTAELLAMIASRREPARLLLLGTYRPAEVSRGHPLTRVVSELIARRRASSIALDGFSVGTLESYLSRRFPHHRFPSDLGPTLHQSTGGNPLFVSTLVDDLERQGLIRRRDEFWELSIPVADVAACRPEGIRRLIDAQVDRLGTLEQRVLEVAAVAGMTFTTGVVAHALDVDADTVDSACERLANERKLLAHGATEAWPDGTIQSRYAFQLALFQHAAQARSTSALARMWQRRIAERLELGHAGHEEGVAAELAVRFEQGHVPARAAYYHVLAGEGAGRCHGLPEAVAHFERARDLIARLPEGRDRDVLELRASLALGGIASNGKDARTPDTR